MYFNNSNNDTNIDNNKKKFGISKMFLVIGFIVIIVIFIVGYLFFNKKKIEYFFELNGLTDVVVYQYDIFEDSGYNAYDSEGNQYNQEVTVIGDVNTEIVGEYKIKYQYRDQELIRVVTVLPVDDGVTFLILQGEMTLFLNVGDVYREPGYIVMDSNNQLSNNDVKVTGSVDTSKPGTYKLSYSLNKNGNKLVEERTVIVMGNDVSISYSPTGYTSGKVKISLVSKDNYFDYFLLPNGTKNSERTISYEVTNNGTYNFKIYLKNGNFKEEKIEVKNIDKEKPTGSCSGYYLENKTYVKVNAKDNNGINKYVVNGSEFNNETITLNGELKNVTVTIYDKVGNSNNVSCQLVDKNPVTNVCNDKTIYPGHKYTFTQAQKEKMAAMVYTEADGPNDLLGMKLVASHMCNYYEKLYKGKEWTGSGLHKLITTSGWYAELTKNAKYNSSKAIALIAVEEVMEKGNRILPHYIDEFDWFPNDVKNPLNRDEYVQGVTTYLNKGNLRSTFWCINYIEESKSGNIFGYTKKPE